MLCTETRIRLNQRTTLKWMDWFTAVHVYKYELSVVCESSLPMKRMAMHSIRSKNDRAAVGYTSHVAHRTYYTCLHSVENSSSVGSVVGLLAFIEHIDRAIVCFFLYLSLSHSPYAGAQNVFVRCCVNNFSGSLPCSDLIRTQYKQHWLNMFSDAT